MLVVITTGVSARPGNYRVGKDGLSHYLMLSLQGGEANMIMPSSEKVDYGYHTAFDIKNSVGADAQAELAYEVRKKNFFFGVLGHAHFTYTGQTIPMFSDGYTCLDINHDLMDYRYNYENYSERQQTMLVGGGIRLGYFLHPNIYMALGAKVEYPLMNNYKTTFDLSTGCTWHFAQDPVASLPGMTDPDYGLYSTEEYQSEGSYMLNNHLMVAPTLEIGGQFRVYHRFLMRVAGYMEYAIPVMGAECSLPAIDYSRVNRDPYCRSREALWSSLRVNSLINNSGLDRVYNRLSVGVKLSFVLDVTTHKDKCITCEDDSGITYSQRAPRHRREDSHSRNRIYGVWR